MREGEIQVFVEGVTNFYNVIGFSKAQVRAPYLIENVKDSLVEHNGMIPISGRNSGSIIFSAPKTMLMQLLGRYDGNTNKAELLLDLLGEIANTISGHARATLGTDFNLASPIVYRGHLDDFDAPAGLQTYCIAIFWEPRQANLIVALK
ncbi:MAG: chemotaxis protein CheX [Polaribacter sp.]|jgi:chemotaxis protein CheX